VEADIFNRLKTEEPARPSFGARPATGPSFAQTAPSAPPKAPSGSFLDDWLKKRQAPAAPPSNPWSNPPRPAATAPFQASPQTPQQSAVPPQPVPTPQSTSAPGVNAPKPENLVPTSKPNVSYNQTSNISSGEVDQQEVTKI